MLSKLLARCISIVLIPALITDPTLAAGAQLVLPLLGTNRGHCLQIMSEEALIQRALPFLSSQARQPKWKIFRRALARRTFLKLTGGAAASLTPLAAQAPAPTPAPTTQDLFKPLFDVGSREKAAADLVAKAESDTNLTRQLFSVAATERAFSTEVRDQATIDFFDKIIWQPLLKFQTAPKALRDLYVENREWPVRRDALRGLADVFRAQPKWNDLQAAPADFDLFIAAAQDKELSDHALFILNETARKNVDQRLVLTGKLLLALEMAHARKDDDTASRIDAALKGSPIGDSQNWINFLQDDNSVDLRDAALGRLVLTGALPDDIPMEINRLVLEALKRSETEEIALQLLERFTDSTSLSEFVRPLFALRQTARLLNVTDRGTGLLINLCLSPEGVADIVHVANSPYTDYLMSVEAIDFLAKEVPNRITSIIGTPHFDTFFKMILDSLEFRDKAASAEILLERVSSYLTEAQKTALTNRRKEVAEFTAKHQPYLVDLRSVILAARLEMDPHPVLQDDLSGIRSERVRSTREILLRGEFGDILELLEYETDPNAQAALIMDIGSSSIPDKLVDDRPNLVAFLRTMENPGSLGSVTPENAQKAQEAAAQALSRADIQYGQLRYRLLEIALRLLAQKIHISAPGSSADDPASRVIRGDAGVNLLSVIADKAKFHDLVALYAATDDNLVRQQALIQLQKKPELDTYLQTYPEALVRLIDDTAHDVRGPLAWQLLATVTKPEIKETILDLMVIRRAILFQGQKNQAVNLGLMLNRVADHSARQNVILFLRELIDKNLIAVPIVLENPAIQTLMRALDDPAMSDSAWVILMAIPTPTLESRRDVLASVIDRVEAARVRNDQASLNSWTEMLTQLLNQPESGTAVVSLWKDGINYRRRLLALHHLAGMDAKIVSSVPGAMEALQRALQDDGMRADANVLLNRIAQLPRASLARPNGPVVARSTPAGGKQVAPKRSTLGRVIASLAAVALAAVRLQALHLQSPSGPITSIEGLRHALVEAPFKELKVEGFTVGWQSRVYQRPGAGFVVKVPRSAEETRTILRSFADPHMAESAFEAWLDILERGKERGERLAVERLSASQGIYHQVAIEHAKILTTDGWVQVHKALIQTEATVTLEEELKRLAAEGRTREIKDLLNEFFRVTKEELWAYGVFDRGVGIVLNWGVEHDAFGNPHLKLFDFGETTDDLAEVGHSSQPDSRLNPELWANLWVIFGVDHPKSLHNLIGADLAEWFYRRMKEEFTAEQLQANWEKKVASNGPAKAWSFKDHDVFGLLVAALAVILALPAALHGTLLDPGFFGFVMKPLLVAASVVAGGWVLPILGVRLYASMAQSHTSAPQDPDPNTVEKIEAAIRQAHPEAILERSPEGNLLAPPKGWLGQTSWIGERPQVRLASWLYSHPWLLSIVVAHERRRLRRASTSKIYAMKALPIFLKDLLILRPRNEILGVIIIILTAASSVLVSYGYIIQPLLSQNYHLALLRIPIALALVPLQFYPVWVLVHSAARFFLPAERLTENSRYYSFIPKTMPPGQPWPWVTIQIPVAIENFKRVIRPTIESAMAAAKEYQAKGGQVNIVILDDGLMRLAKDIMHPAPDRTLWQELVYFFFRRGPVQEPGELSDWENAQSRIADKRTRGELLSAEETDFIARIEYYRQVSAQFPSFGFTARPAEGRVGAFPKAGNLSNHVELADRMEDRLGAAAMSDPGLRLAALADLRSEPGGIAGVAEGDVGFGEYLYVLDKDSTIPKHAIAVTLPEFFANPGMKVGYVQHRTLPTNMGETWFARMISRLSSNYFRFLIPVLNQGGDPAHLIGHNMLLSREALRASIPTEGPSAGKMWATHQVSEDFEIMMRMAAKRYVGIFAAYPDLNFGEGVTRKVDEEAGRQRKFSFGALNLVFHPIRLWPTYGIFQQSFKEYLRSKVVPWYSKLNVLIYLGSYGVTALVFVLCVGQILLIPFGIYQQIFARFSLAILVETNVIYSVIQPASFLVLAWRLSRQPEFRREIPQWRAEFKEEGVSGLFSFAFFNGIMHVTFQGAFNYMAGIRTRFGATPKNELEDASLGAVAMETFQRAGLKMVLSLGSLLFVLWGYGHMGHRFFWNTLTGPFILSIGHLFIPFLLDPLFINKLFGRPTNHDPGDPVAILDHWTAHNGGRQLMAAGA